MELSTAEKIKIIANRQNIALGQLADKTGQSRQNLSGKLNRNNFSENELKQIASALGCQYKSVFIMPDSREI